MRLHHAVAAAALLYCLLSSCGKETSTTADAGTADAFPGPLPMPSGTPVENQPGALHCPTKKTAGHTSGQPSPLPIFQSD